MSKFDTKKIAVISALSAVSFVLILIEFPLLPSTFLKMDFSDIPALLGGMVYGPLAAVLIELIKNVLDLIFKGFGSTMGFGNVMNFICGIAFSVPFCIIYRRLKKKYTLRSLIASSISVVSLVAIGYVFNLVITPLYFKAFVGQELSFDYVTAYAATASLFNLIKGAIISVIIIVLSKYLVEKLKNMLTK